jgi:ABC-type uncharacterized transport system permease subunit
MNKAQKIITGIATIIFFATLLAAPWEIDINDPGFTHVHRNVYSPIFSAYNDAAKIQFGTLFVWWFAIGVIYVALFFLFKTNKVNSN